MQIERKERGLFLRKFISQPKQIGSVMPSSRFLSASIVDAIPWMDVSTVAELGAGTGAITQAIAGKILPGTEVYVFEKDSRMRKRLKEAYPDFLFAANASNLVAILEHRGGERLDCILSGLPFYNFPQMVRDRLMEQIAGALKPGGLFVAFQYSLQMKKQMSKSFRIERIKLVLANLPPAFVYVCRKEQA